MELPVLDKSLDKLDFMKASQKLFKLFSRFEYALKRGGFLKQGPHNSAAADWIAFASKLGADFYHYVDKRDECKAIFAEPPHQLMYEVAGQRAVWSPRNYQADVGGLFEAIKQIRNNLFHGDKSSPRDVGRNASLINSALFILLMSLDWIELDDQRKVDFLEFRDRIADQLVF